MPISSIWKRDFLFPACDGNLWKIMPISSIWKRNFRVFFWACDGNIIWKRDFPFLGLVMGTSGNNANIFYLKTGFPLLFLACDGSLWKIVSTSSIWKRNFRVFSGLVMGASFENGISVSFWAFLENNANIFYLKTGFPFFWACDGNPWKIMPISSIWKRNFRVFSGLVVGTSFENGISVSFWAFLENNANIFYLKTGFPFFWACDGNLWKIMPISSISKNGISLFLGLWWEPLENNANIFYLKTGFPLLFLACDGNLWKIVSTSSIWKRNFRVFSGLVMGASFENGISVSFWAFLENNAKSSIWKRDFPFFGLVMGTSGK